VYARSVPGFSAVSVLALYLFQRVQNHLPLSLGFAPVKSDRPPPASATRRVCRSARLPRRDSAGRAALLALLAG
jgi:hypothetical protein